MPRIHTVAADGTITAGDKLIGSDGAENANFVTRNYTVGGVKDFILGGTHAGSFTTLTTTGNATIGGNVTIAGNITVGDADTDTQNQQQKHIRIQVRALMLLLLLVLISMLRVMLFLLLLTILVVVLTWILPSTNEPDCEI